MLLINHVIFCSKINYFTVYWVGFTYIYIYICAQDENGRKEE